MTLDEKIFAYKARDFIPCTGMITYSRRVENAANAQLREQAVSGLEAVKYKTPAIPKMALLMAAHMGEILATYAIAHTILK